jgi:hypothetical protein
MRAAIAPRSSAWSVNGEGGDARRRRGSRREFGEVRPVARQQVDVAAQVGQRAGDPQAGVAGEDVAPVADAVDPLPRVAGGDEESHGG